MRLKWDEQAKRLAIEHDMVEEVETSLSRKETCSAVGVETSMGVRIKWWLENDLVVVRVS